ncbi:helix-turn-helix domain-containing protein [Clostridium cochlearium]|uniref:helix-turn-helix domain-containing protein n=2 Tax=Clostridium TaxID=1485 RepID=UPI001C0F39C5|nr:helix-turn-helix transcriptional regulator [Clostridium cochlearium]MBU5269470.1 helix-turn-helix transcriptional regulator [Clostridium cochlearium]MBV1820098.1 helix-turn-helix transcriptional regulator [Bacteroidales bacterium MSK.15.36]MCG4572513.1 helix-turn-helix transcriptional regulator [Clostridium cochlearium]MCG4580476.1 helix-turn-helix transcriptional regulator [Clostridium cochlearium]
MGFSYDKLWKLLIDKKMKKIDLQNAVGLSPATIAKMGKDETVNMDVLARICDYFECDINDIISYTPKK